MKSSIRVFVNGCGTKIVDDGADFKRIDKKKVNRNVILTVDPPRVGRVAYPTRA